MNIARSIIFSVYVILLVGLSPTSGCKLPMHKTKWFYPGVKGKGILSCFDYFANGINRKCGNSYNIFTDIAKLNGRGNHDQGIKVIIDVSKGGGHILDYWISGLGSTFADMVISAHRIVICAFGRKHRRSFFFADKGICRSDFGKHYGWRSYDNGYDDIANVISYYRLNNAQADIENIFKKHTKGKGIKALTGSHRLIAQAIWDLSKLFSRANNEWCHDDVYYVFKRVLTVLGALANGYRTGLGNDVVDGLIEYCGEAVKQYGQKDLSHCGSDIKVKLEDCNRTDFNGAISSGQDDDSGDDSNDNANDDNGNNDEYNRDENSSGSTKRKSSSSDENSSGSNKNSSANTNKKSSSSDENSSGSTKRKSSSSDENSSSSDENSSSSDDNSSGSNENSSGNTNKRSSSSDKNSSSNNENSSGNSSKKSNSSSENSSNHSSKKSNSNDENSSSSNENSSGNTSRTSSSSAKKHRKHSSENNDSNTDTNNNTNNNDSNQSNRSSNSNNNRNNQETNIVINNNYVVYNKEEVNEVSEADNASTDTTEKTGD
ncbi:probable cyclin-dependent serine/threonine-protein kinase DDB_G0292550 isoform X1 [Bombyx mandarina]|uniref:Probable cyclin-dependent serine/threonine-protein kinase DDB_G0292550 isoform X1 n=1 Tax=Bombyx mandarina TaxID=7092 RepID=A0A6J2KBJ6_BOMMA|nr:probable cyclin-dependent serine/threonine-protein kinase DDB_G0292550 isoform X1 [Bombyx mandarina]